MDPQEVKISPGIPYTVKKEAAACSQPEEFAFQKEIPRTIGRSQDRPEGPELRHRWEGSCFSQDCGAVETNLALYLKLNIRNPKVENSFLCLSL